MAGATHLNPIDPQRIGQDSALKRSQGSAAGIGDAMETLGLDIDTKALKEADGAQSREASYELRQADIDPGRGEFKGDVNGPQESKTSDSPALTANQQFVIEHFEGFDALTGSVNPQFAAIQNAEDRQYLIENHLDDLAKLVDPDSSDTSALMKETFRLLAEKHSSENPVQTDDASRSRASTSSSVASDYSDYDFDDDEDPFAQDSSFVKEFSQPVEPETVSRARSNALVGDDILAPAEPDVSTTETSSNLSTRDKWNLAQADALFGSAKGLKSIAFNKVKQALQTLSKKTDFDSPNSIATHLKDLYTKINSWVKQFPNEAVKNNVAELLSSTHELFQQANDVDCYQLLKSTINKYQSIKLDAFHQKEQAHLDEQKAALSDLLTAVHLPKDRPHVFKDVSTIVADFSRSTTMAKIGFSRHGTASAPEKAASNPDEAVVIGRPDPNAIKDVKISISKNKGLSSIPFNTFNKQLTAFKQLSTTDNLAKLLDSMYNAVQAHPNEAVKKGVLDCFEAVTDMLDSDKTGMYDSQNIRNLVLDLNESVQNISLNKSHQNLSDYLESKQTKITTNSYVRHARNSEIMSDTLANSPLNLTDDQLAYVRSNHIDELADLSFPELNARLPELLDDYAQTLDQDYANKSDYAENVLTHNFPGIFTADELAYLFENKMDDLVAVTDPAAPDTSKLYKKAIELKELHNADELAKLNARISSMNDELTGLGISKEDSEFLCSNHLDLLEGINDKTELQEEAAQLIFENKHPDSIDVIEDAMGTLLDDDPVSVDSDVKATRPTGKSTLVTLSDFESPLDLLFETGIPDSFIDYLQGQTAEERTSTLDQFKSLLLEMPAKECTQLVNSLLSSDVAIATLSAAEKSSLQFTSIQNQFNTMIGNLPITGNREGTEFLTNIANVYQAIESSSLVDADLGLLAVSKDSFANTIASDFVRTQGSRDILDSFADWVSTLSDTSDAQLYTEALEENAAIPFTENKDAIIKDCVSLFKDNFSGFEETLKECFQTLARHTNTDFLNFQVELRTALFEAYSDDASLAENFKTMNNMLNDAHVAVTLLSYSAQTEMNEQALDDYVGSVGGAEVTIRDSGRVQEELSTVSEMKKQFSSLLTINDKLGHTDYGVNNASDKLYKALYAYKSGVTYKTILESDFMKEFLQTPAGRLFSQINQTIFVNDSLDHFPLQFSIKNGIEPTDTFLTESNRTININLEDTGSIKVSISKDFKCGVKKNGPLQADGFSFTYVRDYYLDAKTQLYERSETHVTNPKYAADMSEYNTKALAQIEKYLKLTATSYKEE